MVRARGRAADRTSRLGSYDNVVPAAELNAVQSRLLDAWVLPEQNVENKVTTDSWGNEIRFGSGAGRVIHRGTRRPYSGKRVQPGVPDNIGRISSTDSSHLPIVSMLCPVTS